jgi:hypothetical protein
MRPILLQRFPNQNLVDFFGTPCRRDQKSKITGHFTAGHRKTILEAKEKFTPWER